MTSGTSKAEHIAAFSVVNKMLIWNGTEWNQCIGYYKVFKLKSLSFN